MPGRRALRQDLQEMTDAGIRGSLIEAAAFFGTIIAACIYYVIYALRNGDVTSAALTSVFGMTPCLLLLLVCMFRARAEMRRRRKQGP